METLMDRQSLPTGTFDILLVICPPNYHSLGVMTFPGKTVHTRMIVFTKPNEFLAVNIIPVTEFHCFEVSYGHLQSDSVNMSLEDHSFLLEIISYRRKGDKIVSEQKQIYWGISSPYLGQQGIDNYWEKKWIWIIASWASPVACPNGLSSAILFADSAGTGTFIPPKSDDGSHHLWYFKSSPKAVA